MNYYTSRIHTNLFWLFTAGILLSTYHLLPYESELVEKYYSNGFYAVYREMWDYSIGWSPIPLVYILFGVLILWSLSLMSGMFRRSLRENIFGFVRNLALISCVGVSVFYLFWGFNYKRLNPLSQLIDTKLEMNEDELFSEYERITDSLLVLSSTDKDKLVRDVNTVELRETLTAIFDQISVTYYGRVNIRKVAPKGVLLRFSTAGIYLPFVGEGHIDAGLHPITWPFTELHEMSHAYGFTGEDICNFWALLACVNSDNPSIKYSGYFAYWRYLRGNSILANRERFDRECSWVPLEFLDDYKEILKFQDRYPDLLPKLRDLIYDNYLKSHGIRDGQKNYSRIILLAHEWQERYGSLNISLLN